MKEMRKYQTELLINYLKQQIDRNWRAAEEMRKSEKTIFTALSYESRAHELECALAYLMGLLHEEK